ncbi:MAG: histidinol-phosphate transaminase [Dermatophilaceae bacterium]
MSVVGDLLRPDLRGRTAYGAPQLDVPVRLNTNESSYAVPAPVVAAALRALGEELADLNRYPDREFTVLREALSAYLARQAGASIPVAALWAANGSNEVLLHLVQAFGGGDRVALGFTPAYSMHPIIAATCAMPWADGDRGAPGDPFGLTPESVAAQCARHDPAMVFLCSPNNPTGTALTPEVVIAAYEAAPRAVIVVDEAYAEYARPGTRSALHLLAGRPRLVVTRTMSKAFALAGGRLGYLAADPELVDALRLVRMPYHLSTQTQVIARVALEHADDLLATVEATKAQRDRMVRELTTAGLDPVPSDANFVLFGGLVDERMTWQHLLDQGVLVRDVGIRHHLRVSAGTPAETDAFLAAVAGLPAGHRLHQSQEGTDG